MGHDSLTEINSHCISANAMQHSSSIATETRREIWQCGKKVKGHSEHLVDPEFSMLYTKIQSQSFLGSGEDF